MLHLAVKTTFIYALCAPDSGKARYIGKADDPQKRLMRDHLGLARRGRKTHLHNWIREVLAQGGTPKLEILFKVPNDEWQFWEKFMISGFAEEGYGLVNQTPGGEGGPVWLGRKQTVEHIANLSAARKGQKRTLEQCENISNGKLGRKLGPQSTEHLANRSAAVSAAKKGKPWTEKQRTSMAAARSQRRAKQ